MANVLLLGVLTDSKSNLNITIMEDRIDFIDKDGYQLIIIFGKFCSDTLVSIKKSVKIAMAKGFAHIAFDIDKTTSIKGELLIVGSKGIVHRVLDVSKLFTIIPHFETVQELEEHYEL